MPGGDEQKWVSYSEKEEPDANEIPYADAKEYQQTEHGPIVNPNEISARAKRLNRREGYSPSESDKPRIASALATRLDLPDSQTDKICSAMKELNLSAFGSQRQIEAVALGVITVFVNYHRFQIRNNPDAKRIAEERQFIELLMEFDVSYSDLGTIKRIAKDELKEQGYFMNNIG